MPRANTARAKTDRMVQRQIARRGIGDGRVLAAMRKVERADFLPDAMREFAYEDTALPIEEGQTVSQPYIVARMAEAAELGTGDRVLEVGAGSGYAAAVLAELAAQVYAIERHPALAELARSRLSALGYANVEVRVGDGTLGWPEAAPFNAIVASAGGPRVPEPLRRQLAVGGRLVMPVGASPNRQRLMRVTRTGSDTYEEEALEDVRFVPLIGAEGWSSDIVEGASSNIEPASADGGSLPNLIRQSALVLADPRDANFAEPFDRFGDRRVVLLGEASHGTSEFYRARAAITERLIEKHGFDIVAVEADWPDAAVIDRYVRHRTSADGPKQVFRRFPVWMWRNAEVDAFVARLREHNRPLRGEKQAGFYGLDIYSLSDSIDAVLGYLDRVDSGAAQVARERYGCLTPWQQDPSVYGRAVLNRGYRDCEPAVVSALTDLLSNRLSYAAKGDDRFFDAVQNAQLVASAERYYRIIYYGGAESWNLRDRHMFDTLARLLDHRGPGSKAVVWAHNSHIGDARFTDMGRVRDELNLGQLCRERFGDQMVSIGFGTHTGTVAAAHGWGEPMEIMEVRPSLADSIERHFHDSGLGRGVLVLADTKGILRERLAAEHLERFIGVIYWPETERQSHYAGVELPGQFDAYVWFDRTSAVEPLPASPRPGTPETWPFGL
ncbi:protein-L-isoaspartate(D-aspartate) O-methyltransferase [Enhydrobacter aerosaccus]|uniref:Protein-L-isoaspartate O-methyltransferase n=1 Tax=Enhydrobacter aerosaccus TaxID=225324 RepID=A0A1T4RWF7_9HYPH|nr:protein-L-isoaspartate(D-aspartate) O-methyltransferase [Enhydrobacter aerosaccus]SKA20344.1 protein-L-isoaspartate(D-aspartate) O-methyltransferase [Enhydrobacter aerosaccus]